MSDVHDRSLSLATLLVLVYLDKGVAPRRLLRIGARSCRQLHFPFTIVNQAKQTVSLPFIRRRTLDNNELAQLDADSFSGLTRLATL